MGSGVVNARALRNFDLGFPGCPYKVYRCSLASSMAYTGRQMTDKFEILSRPTPLSCDQPEVGVSVVLKDAVESLPVTLL